MTDEVKLLAELIYLEEKPGESWEKLQSLYKEQRYVKAQTAINCLGKMNKVIVSPSQVKKEVDDRFIFNKLVNIINEFNKKLTTTRPALYPTEELVHRILAE